MSDPKTSGKHPRTPPPGQSSAAESANAGGSASGWLANMIGERRMSQVRPNMARSGDLITQAHTHIASARKLASTDSTLALAACHDAIRKALDAHAGAMGYRFEDSPGAHRTAIEYGHEVLGGHLDSDDLDEANRLRKAPTQCRVRRGACSSDRCQRDRTLRRGRASDVKVVAADLAGTVRGARRPRRPSSAD